MKQNIKLVNKLIFKIFIVVLVWVSLVGCTRTVYVYPQQEYPELQAPAKVVSNYDSYIWKKCLYINDHNTSLCGDDLKKVLTTIKSLRTNEKACSEVINVYNDFVKNEKIKTKTRKQNELEFGF